MLSLLTRLPLVAMWREEFAAYHATTFRRDLLAGLTVAAVGLPLALAFGVASGANAAAGLVTAILAGILIGVFGGGGFQVSGPTGAMSAVLILLARQYGLGGLWVAGILAGFFMLLLGIFRLGRAVAFIPSPVITGFTSGIAIVIAVGQFDNVLGVTTPPADNTLAKLVGYVSQPILPDWHALVAAGVVIATMIVFPRINRTIPGSLVGIVLATLIVRVLGWHLPPIGDIPRTILLDHRLTWGGIPWSHLGDLLIPAISIAALGAIESLLCGSVGATMSGQPFDSNQELIGQGIGNMIIPFFGGVPATAAIARTSVGIKSGSATRMTSIIHSLTLLTVTLLLAPLIQDIPLAALGGVLLVTTWRMNEWETLHFFWRTRLSHALIGFGVTLVATAALDLTKAILIGVTISALIYVRQSATSTTVTREAVDPEKLQAQGYPMAAACPGIHVFYLTGPIFFGSVMTVLEAFQHAQEYHGLVISMRGVPLVDAMGIQALRQIVEAQHAHGGNICFTALQPSVAAMFTRTGLSGTIGKDNIYWNSAQAIIAMHEHRAVHACPRCHASGEGCEAFRAARDETAHAAALVTSDI